MYLFLLILLAVSAIAIGLLMRGNSLVARALAAIAIALPWACLATVLWSMFLDAVYTHKVAAVLVDGQIRITEGTVLINELGRNEVAAVYEDESLNDPLLLPDFPAVRSLSAGFGIPFMATALLCFGVSSVFGGAIAHPGSATIPAP